MNGDSGQDRSRLIANDRGRLDLSTTFQFGPFTFTAPALEFCRDDVGIEIGPDAARVLLHLLEHANQVVTEMELVTEMRPGATASETDASEETDLCEETSIRDQMAAALETVRRAISGTGPCECAIETRRLRRDIGGYVFVGDVERVRRPCPPISGSAAPGIGGHELIADSEPSGYGDDPVWKPPVITNHQLSRLHAKLTPDTQLLVEALAVVGMAMHPSVASQVTGLPAERLDAALAEASCLGLLRVEPGHAIRFPRPELRRALDETLSHERRAELEAAAGRAVLDFSGAFDHSAPLASAVSAQLDGLLGVIDRTRMTIDALAYAMDDVDADGALDDALFPGTARVELARITRTLEGDLERAIELAVERLEAASRLRPRVAGGPDGAAERRVRAVVEKLRVAS